MGASFSLVLVGRDRAGLESAAAAAFAEVHRLDRMLSNYLVDSEWSAMNRSAAKGPFPVSPELFTVLSSCLEYSRQSSGAFDITVGPLIKVWGFYKGEGGMPRPKEVADALTRVGYRHVQLDPAARTVRFARSGMELDPGGIGKGYAVDRMVDVLKRAGVRVALVSASGSSIYGMGAPPEDPKGWPITIRAPRDPDAVAAHGLPRGHVSFHVRQLRKVLLGQRANVLAHRGSADGLSRAGHVRRLRGFATNDRQRGVDEAVLHQRPRLDVGAQAGRVPRVLL